MHDIKRSIAAMMHDQATGLNPRQKKLWVIWHLSQQMKKSCNAQQCPNQDVDIDHRKLYNTVVKKEDGFARKGPMNETKVVGMPFDEVEAMFNGKVHAALLEEIAMAAAIQMRLRRVTRGVREPRLLQVTPPPGVDEGLWIFRVEYTKGNKPTAEPVKDVNADADLKPKIPDSEGGSEPEIEAPTCVKALANVATRLLRRSPKPQASTRTPQPTQQNKTQDASDVESAASISIGRFPSLLGCGCAMKPAAASSVPEMCEPKTSHSVPCSNAAAPATLALSHPTSEPQAAAHPKKVPGAISRLLKHMARAKPLAATQVSTGCDAAVVALTHDTAPLSTIKTAAKQLWKRVTCRSSKSVTTPSTPTTFTEPAPMLLPA